MYSGYLKDLLRPMRIYDVNSGAGAAELEALGKGMDGVFAALEAVEREMVVSTAEGTGLERYEALLPYKPVASTLEARRTAITALLTVSGESFTTDALCEALSGCGITAVVEETGTPQVVRVRFPGTMGVPEGIEKLKERIEMLLPCHLAVDYFYKWFNWLELESTFADWQALEMSGLSWAELELLEVSV